MTTADSAESVQAPPMKVRVASDLHFEFHQDRGALLAAELAVGLGPADVLVVAGDLDCALGIEDALKLLAQSVTAQIVYVTGNHEFYGGDRESVVASIRRAANAHSNLHWLDNEAVTILGQRFLGTPLWFRRPGPKAPKWAMSDFSAIRSFESWVYAENQRALTFLQQQLRKGDVVVSHYLPTPASIAPQFRGSALNPFFLCDVSGLIDAREPALWIHGHTHSSCRYRHGPTEVVCNPFGYVGHDLNPQYRTFDFLLSHATGMV